MTFSPSSDSQCSTVFRSARTLAALFAIACSVLHAARVGRARLYSIPADVRSNHFVVSVNGHRTPVFHAATGYYLLNFDLTGSAVISVTSEDPHHWDRGVEIQPLRLGIRPVRHGGTILFPMNGPGKVSITRPGDHFADADMLFLFANPPDQPAITAQTPGLRYYGPGSHHENIDAHSGDSIYLADGAVVFGSLNVWQVHDVHVFGHGAIVYDGPQNPHADEGWMHKPNWHCIVMDHANNIEIDGITCIVRSRTWQIQMRDSRHIGYYNLKVIGGNPNDANQDGMDWLGGGDTTVRNSFFRASDDDFAVQGNWDGYTEEAMRTPGHDVQNITIENTITSTSISNTVRVGWPEKIFNSAHFHMRDIDVIHTGYGACKVPFAFFELWADPEGRGSHTDYTFENIRLEDWYSLFQIRQPNPKIRDIVFTNIAALSGPGMVASVLRGDVGGVTLSGVSALQGATNAVRVDQGAAAPIYAPASPDPGFAYNGGLLHPHQAIHFHANAASIPGRRFEWSFGDGSYASGAQVAHAFPDTMGTLLDGSGSFLILLHTTDPNGKQAWSMQPVIVAKNALPALTSKSESVESAGAGIEREFTVPADGGYTFTLLAAQNASFAIDGSTAAQTPRMRPQVCGSPGYAVQAAHLSVALRAGTHRIHVLYEPEENRAEAASGDGIAPTILWQGPGLPLQPVPIAAP
jgi:hypothetical protein